MGGKKGNKSKKSKSTKLKSITPGMSVKEKAKVRHHNFKATGVQTHGGTKKSYSKREAEKIGKAVSADNKLGGTATFASVTAGAKNPLNRAPDNQGVKYGELLQPVKDFSESLGLDYSAFDGAMKANPFDQKFNTSALSFGDSVKAGARFNEAGTGGPSYAKDTAFLNFNKIKDSPANTPLGDGMIKESLNQMQQNLKQKYDTMRDEGFMSDQEYNKQMKRLLGDQFKPQSSLNTGTLTATHDNRLFKSVPATGPAGDRPASDAYKEGMLQKNILPGTPGNPLGIKLAAAGDLSGLGIGAPKATGYTPTIGGLAESLGLDSKTGQEVGTSAGGLNVGGDYGLSIGNMFSAPTNNRMLSEGGNLQFSDMFEADTTGAKISKGINAVKNRIPILNMLPDMKINTVAEEAQRRYLGYNPNLPASALARMNKKGGGGTRLPLTPTVAQEVAPQYQPVPSESTTPTTQTGIDPNKLLQIQQQAYAQAYNPMLIGGFNPQFRFGAATPTIDYSTYFNY